MSRTLTHIAQVVGTLGPARHDLAEILAELHAVRGAYDDERAARVNAERARAQLEGELDEAQEARLVAEETIAMLEERIAAERAEAARDRLASSLELRAQRESMEQEVAMLTAELRHVAR